METTVNPAPLRKALPGWLRVLLVVAGTLSVILGVIGIYLPVLPTTPFLLLALACYLRSSEGMYRWLLMQPLLREHLHQIFENRAVPRNVKFVSPVIAWIVLSGLATFVVEGVFPKTLLIALAVAKTGIMLRVPTLGEMSCAGKDAWTPTPLPATETRKVSPSHVVIT
jgi:uncharacterized membrane protein YbaN (DUF454 family)